MFNRGVILVLALTAAGLAAASVAVWYQHQQTHRALGLWGAEVASRIERAAIVELIELENGAGANTRQPEAAIDISHARGLVHFRRSLLQDVNFDWETDSEAPGFSESDWDYVVRFSDKEDSVELLFELDEGFVTNRAVPGKVGRLTDRMSQGLSRFFDETLAQATGGRD